MLLGTDPPTGHTQDVEAHRTRLDPVGVPDRHIAMSLMQIDTE